MERDRETKRLSSRTQGEGECVHVHVVITQALITCITLMLLLIVIAKMCNKCGYSSEGNLI